MKVLSLASIIKAAGHHFSMTDAYKYISENKNNLSYHSGDNVKLIKMPGTTIHMKFYGTSGSDEYAKQDVIGIASYKTPTNDYYATYREYVRQSILPPDIFTFPEFENITSIDTVGSHTEPYKQYALVLFYIFDTLGFDTIDEVRNFLQGCVHHVDNKSDVYLEPFPAEIANKRKGTLSFINGISTGGYYSQLISFTKRVYDNHTDVTDIFQYEYINQLIPLLSRDELHEIQNSITTLNSALRSVQNYYISSKIVSYYLEMLGTISERVNDRQTEIIQSQVITVSKRELDSNPLLLEQLDNGARINIIISGSIPTEAWG